MGTLLDKVSLSNSSYDFAQATPADPDIPTQDYHATLRWTVRTGAGLDQIESDRRAYVAPPPFEPESLIIMVRSKTEVGWRGQNATAPP